MSDRWRAGSAWQPGVACALGIQMVRRRQSAEPALGMGWAGGIPQYQFGVDDDLTPGHFAVRRLRYEHAKRQVANPVARNVYRSERRVAESEKFVFVKPGT